MRSLPPRDVRTLDHLMLFLALSPFDRPPAHSSAQKVLAVCGNWYDLPHKAALLATQAAADLDAVILLVGGRAERLTPLEAEAVGGEPLLLQHTLASEFGLPPRRSVIYTGSRVTTHNLMAMLHYAKQHQEFTGGRIGLLLIEERFLVRRAAATLRALLRADEAARTAIDWVAVEPVGDAVFDDLVRTHRGQTSVRGKDENTHCASSLLIMLQGSIHTAGSSRPGCGRVSAF